MLQKVSREEELGIGCRGGAGPEGNSEVWRRRTSLLSCHVFGPRIAWAWVALISLPLGVAAWSKPAKQGGSSPDPVEQALDYRHNLEYESARRLLDAWLREHPSDPRALNYLGSVILHHEMFHRGILETHFYGGLGDMLRPVKIEITPSFQKELFGILEKAQSVCEEQLKRNSKDPEALYWAGLAHATRAVFYYTMAKSNLAALREATQAREYHTRLLKVDPAFVDALLVVGINDYVSGSLPWYLKVLASLVGYRGNRTQGIEEVRRVAEQGCWARDDAKFILAVFYQREKKYAETLQVLQGLAQLYPRNFLIQHSIARIYEIQGNWAAAAKVYDAVLANYEAHEPVYAEIPAAKFYYEAGKVHERLAEWREALARYEAAARFPGDNIYVYRAELAAADIYLRLNQPGDASRRYQRVAGGVPNTEEGRAARRALKKLQENVSPGRGGSE